MRLMYGRCAAIDVHKKTGVVCCRQTEADGRVKSEVKTFGTTTPELLQMMDWLNKWEVTTVAIESTAEYWKPVFNLLEGEFEVILVNAKHVKQVPGRKTDVKDAEWLAELLSYGLLKASYIPAKPQRDLRDLTRHRVTLVQERARIVNRLQKVLEHANIKLASVASDIMGVSGRQMLEAIVGGQTDAAAMADLAKGRMRHKMEALEKALTGVVRPHHRFMIAEYLAHIDFLDEQVERVSDKIGEQIEMMSQVSEPDETPPGGESTPTWSASVELLDSAPGVDKKAAEIVLAEMGIDMTQFATADHLAAWAGLAPGNNQSGSKRHKANIREGNRNLRQIMVQVGWAAVRTKGSYAQALYRRLESPFRIGRVAIHVPRNARVPRHVADCRSVKRPGRGPARRRTLWDCQSPPSQAGPTQKPD